MYLAPAPLPPPLVSRGDATTFTAARGEPESAGNPANEAEQRYKQRLAFFLTGHDGGIVERALQDLVRDPVEERHARERDRNQRDRAAKNEKSQERRVRTLPIGSAVPQATDIVRMGEAWKRNGLSD